MALDFRKKTAVHSRPVSLLQKHNNMSLSNISSMRRSVSSPDETPRRLKIRRPAEYFYEQMLDSTSQTK